MRKLGTHRVISIGSVNFVQAYLKEHGLPRLEAMNIPLELWKDEYLRRAVWDRLSKEEVLRQSSLYGGPLLVKPAGEPKAFETTTTKYPETIPEDALLFATQLLKPEIVAEWRAFVLRGRILAIHPYVLKDWAFPNRKLAEMMAKDIFAPSCTIDLGVLETGETVLLEAHPFISCGLYGFKGPDLVRMAIAAWKHQIRPL